MRHVTILLPVLLALALVTPTAVLAQDATPTAWAGEAIDPDECQVKPITVEKVIALWFPEAAGTPTLAAPEAEMELSSVPLPLGEPADPATVAAVTATVRELLACQNRIENGRFYALVTDALLRRWGPIPGETPEDIPAHLAPLEPIPVEEYVRLLAVTDVSVMADGRVAALVVSDDPPIPPEGPETLLMLFVEEEGRWLIDEITGFTAVVQNEEGAASASTPTP